MFVAISIYLKPLEEVDRFYLQHAAWLEKYYASGHLLGSGRRVPRNGGLIIGRADSLEAFTAILAEEPFQQHGLAKYDIFEFTPGDLPRRSPALETFLNTPLDADHGETSS
jgi:uncharacterized protein YciI